MTHQVIHVRDNELLVRFLSAYNALQPCLLAFDVEINQPQEGQSVDLISIALPYVLGLDSGRDLDIWAVSVGRMTLSCDEVRCAPSTVILLDIAALEPQLLREALQTIFCGDRCARVMCGNDGKHIAQMGVFPRDLLNIQLLELSKGRTGTSLAVLSQLYGVGEKDKWNHSYMRWNGQLSEAAMRYAAKDALLTLAVYMSMLSIAGDALQPPQREPTEDEISEACIRLSKSSIFLAKKLPERSKVLRSLRNSLPMPSLSKKAHHDLCEIILDEMVRRGMFLVDESDGLMPTAKMLPGWKQPTNLPLAELTAVVMYIQQQQFPCPYISLLCNAAVQFWRSDNAITRRCKAQLAIRQMILAGQLSHTNGTVYLVGSTPVARIPPPPVVPVALPSSSYHSSSPSHSSLSYHSSPSAGEGNTMMRNSFAVLSSD